MSTGRDVFKKERQYGMEFRSKMSARTKTFCSVRKKPKSARARVLERKKVISK